MIRDPLQLPAARTWRDIPQPLLPRAMSPEGRWRLAKSVARASCVAAVCGGVAWGGWLVFASLQHDRPGIPGAAKSTPMKPPVLRTDGVLDAAWLSTALPLPRNASLMGLDLVTLRARLLGDGQVAAATLTRQFPDTLIVHVSERVPVARLMTDWMGQRQVLLVARDGVVFAGRNYDPSTLRSLPWLDGVKLIPEGGGFRPIPGMSDAADLLGRARLEAEDLYSTWRVISLARLASDRLLEIRTKGAAFRVYFTTRDDYFRQLAKLDYVWGRLAKIPNLSGGTIDLSLGTDVPVRVEQGSPAGAPPSDNGIAETAAATRPGPDAGADRSRRAGASHEFIVPLSPTPNPNQREL